MATAVATIVKPAQSSGAKPKNVTWASQDKLCQVRLFEAEDAPALSGKVLQEFLQAKRCSLLHISEDDVPPGFEAIAANRSQCTVDAITSMVPQLIWQSPSKVIYCQAWQVAGGEDSLEVSAQKQRELRVLEAFYPRLSVIPESPAEPQEKYPDIQDDVIPEISMMPIEDEDQEFEGQNSPGPNTFSECDVSSHSVSAPIKYLDLPEQHKDFSSVSTNTFPSDANPGVTMPNSGSSNANVAAAAAAAYTVLKAKESGLIDHDLLLQILNNPGLMKTLLSTDPQQANKKMSLPDMVSNGLFSNMISPETMSDMQIKDTGITSRTNTPIWNSFSPNTNGSELRSPAFSSQGTGGMPIFRSPFTPQEGMLKEMIQQHGCANAVRPKHGVTIASEGMECIVGKAGEYAKGSSVQTWVENNHVSHSQASFQEAINVDVSRPKSRKPCLFFNTPRGCRNGVNCYFMHGSIPSTSTRIRGDMPEHHQLKKQKFDMVNTQ